MKRMLIVDDVPALCDLLTDFFKNQYEIKSAYNGADAFEISRGFKPEIVISDFNMPGINGLDLLSKLQSLHFPFRFILMSGRLTAADHNYSKLGVFSFIQKPFRRSELTDIVAAALSDIIDDVITN